jgi:F0F1-type ATP synthase membrane subunit b/b'
MLSLDYSVIVIFIFLWVLVYALNRVFFKRVRKVITERETKIQKNQESQQKAIDAYERSISEIEENLKAARAISDKTREELEKEALKEKNRLLEEINAECRSQVEKASQRLKEQMKRLKKRLETETEDLAERIEKRLLH